jgi:putative endonuclease
VRGDRYSAKRVGDLGEDAACQHLVRNGYEIVVRNFRWRHGELDIVARKDNVLAFVEVKSQYRGGFGDPLTWVTPKKQRQITLTALRFLQVNEIVDTDCRFDVIVVSFGGRHPEIRHIENAFWADPDAPPPPYLG